jgi:hypothetical protein
VKETNSLRSEIRFPRCALELSRFFRRRRLRHRDPRKRVHFALCRLGKGISLKITRSSCHTELSPRPRDLRFEISDEISVSNHVSSLRVSPTRGLQRRHLVLQRVSDARARPGLPYLFRSLLMIRARVFPLSTRPFFRFRSCERNLFASSRD